MIYPTDPMSFFQGNTEHKLPDVLESINKRYGPGTVCTGTAQSLEKKYAVSSIISLNMAIGAIPLGRIIEIHGGEDSGKTALALHLAQQIGGPVLFMDADCGLSPVHLRSWGLQDLYCMHPETLEDALEICRSAAGAFGTIVIDTLAALPTRADLSYRLDESCLTDGGSAKILSHALPVLVRILRRTGCTLILVNQMRNNPDIIYGRTEYPTGGRAIGYYAALRMEVYRTERNQAGQGVRIVVVKCKYSPPFRRVDVGLIYGRGLVGWRTWKAADDRDGTA